MEQCLKNDWNYTGENQRDRERERERERELRESIKRPNRTKIFMK